MARGIEVSSFQECVLIEGLYSTPLAEASG